MTAWGGRGRGRLPAALRERASNTALSGPRKSSLIADGQPTSKRAPTLGTEPKAIGSEAQSTPKRASPVCTGPKGPALGTPTRKRRVSLPAGQSEGGSSNDADALERARAVLQRARLRSQRKDFVSLGVSVWTGYNNSFVVLDCRADEPVERILARAVQHTNCPPTGSLLLFTQEEFDRKGAQSAKVALVERSLQQCKAVLKLSQHRGGQAKTLKQCGLKDGDALHVQSSRGWQCWT